MLQGLWAQWTRKSKWLFLRGILSRTFEISYFFFPKKSYFIPNSELLLFVYRVILFTAKINTFIIEILNIYSLSYEKISNMLRLKVGWESFMNNKIEGWLSFNNVLQYPISAGLIIWIIWPRTCNIY